MRFAASIGPAATALTAIGNALQRSADYSAGSSLTPQRHDFNASNGRETRIFLHESQKLPVELVKIHDSPARYLALPSEFCPLFLGCFLLLRRNRHSYIPGIVNRDEQQNREHRRNFVHGF
jgi:hypothetical protein